MSESSNNYHFVIATPKCGDDFREKSQMALFIDKMTTLKNIKYTVIFENKEGLPKVYNQFINEKYKDEKIIFVHDDVIIDDLFWEEKLTIAFEKYDIVGLAGSKKCNLSSPIMAWHLMCNREDMIGEVAHSKDKNSWTTVFGPSNSRALIIDGLFIAVNVKRLLETNTKFDESFDFHHYDMSFCIRANQNKLKMGVYPIKVTHYGLGDSMNSESWKKSSEIFKKKYIK
jgi:hypothetical protein